MRHVEKKIHGNMSQHFLFVFIQFGLCTFLLFYLYLLKLQSCKKTCILKKKLKDSLFFQVSNNTSRCIKKHKGYISLFSFLKN